MNKQCSTHATEHVHSFTFHFFCLSCENLRSENGRKLRLGFGIVKILSHFWELGWERILTIPNLNLSFLPFSNLKFSQLKQKKWKVKLCTCSGLWVEPCFFTNLRLKMHDKRDMSSKFYLCRWTSIWRMRNFQCKVMIGKASLRSRDAFSMLTLSWNSLYRAVELQLQKEKLKMVETVRVITGQVLGHG